MTQQNNTELVVDDLGKLLPDRVTSASVRSGVEWVIPLPYVMEAVEIANDNLIAVLGVEVFRVSLHGLSTEGYSGYELEFEGDWRSFVSKNNQAATEYISKHPFDKGYGYILTTTSETEFNHLRDQIT